MVEPNETYAVSKVVTSATATARFVRLPQVFNSGRRADLAVAVAEVPVSDMALFCLISKGIVLNI